MDRRTFLKITATSAAINIASRDTSLAGTNAHAKVIPIADGSAAEDEKYWSLVRDEFPISREVLYFNNGTMGPSPRIVTDRVTQRIIHVDSTGDYGGDYEGIKSAVARVINAKSGDDIAFTHNVSEAISIVSSGIELKAGDEVLLTNQEHAGNAIPWLARKNRDGIAIKFVPLTNEKWEPYSDDEFLQRIKDAITPRTRAISMPHLTCTTGHILPIKRISQLAREHGIWMLADGAHPPGMLLTDVQDLGVHAYASCGHKWLCGPKGIGFLYIAPDFREHVIPTWTGGEADKYWGYDARLDFMTTASKYDFATQNFALFDGLHAAIDYQESIGLDKIEQRVLHLTTMLRNGLKELAPGHFHFLTPPNSMSGLTTIKLEHMDYKEFFNKMWEKRKVRTRVVPEGGLEASRFSVHIYTSEDDVASFLEVAKATLA